MILRTSWTPTRPAPTTTRATPTTRATRATRSGPRPAQDQPPPLVRAIDIASYAYRATKYVSAIEKGGLAGVEAADRLVDETAAQGVLFVKMSQFIAARGDVLDAETTKALARLQSDVPTDGLVPPIVPGYVIEPTPFAVASIAAVYAATKLTDGRRVAIKVVRPGVKDRVTFDFPLFIGVLKIAATLGFAGATNLLEIVTECRPVIVAELDLIAEAKTQMAFRKKFADVPWLSVPRVLEAGEGYMVSDFVESRKITDAVPMKFLATRLFELYVRMLLDVGVVHADPHAGNIGVRADGTFVMYDFGAVIDVRDIRPLAGRLLKATILEDADGAIEALTDMQIIKSGSVTRLRRIVPKLRAALRARDPNAELANIPEFADNTNRIFELTTKYVYLIRSLVIVQGIIQFHDPSFRLDAYAATYDDLISGVTDVPAWDAAKEFASDVLRTPGTLRGMQSTVSEMRDTMSVEIAETKKVAIIGAVVALAFGILT